MGQEIERKFLVNDNSYKAFAQSQVYILQGYLCSVPERTVRIRIAGEAGFLTIKGIGNQNGLSRFEWEQPIKLEDARALIRLCEPGMVEKIRYKVIEGNKEIVVDEFLHNNHGLTIAEIELSSEDEAFFKPAWLGEEVTGNKKYYNSMLRLQPFSTW